MLCALLSYAYEANQAAQFDSQNGSKNPARQEEARWKQLNQSTVGHNGGLILLKAIAYESCKNTAPLAAENQRCMRAIFDEFWLSSGPQTTVKNAELTSHDIGQLTSGTAWRINLCTTTSTTTAV